MFSNNDCLNSKQVIQAWLFLIWTGLVGVVLPVKASEQILELDDVSLTIQVTDAVTSEKVTETGDTAKARLLWLPSEYGVLPQEQHIAKQLAQHGMESWFVDLYEAMFLSPTPSAVDDIPSDLIAKLIAYAKLDGKPLWVVAPNKAAQLAVRGLVENQPTAQNYTGLILINPNLYLNTPKPGQEARYWSQVSAVNLPISILQAEQSPWRWRVTQLADELQNSGSDVFVQIQPQARDRFYFRPDALEIERDITEHLADKIRQMMYQQLHYMEEKRQSGTLTNRVENQIESTRSTELQVYKGEQSRALQLENMSGEKVTLDDYQGKVVLLNFWASWCPPCVHEMPSM
ncbi:MAG TPA: TlpA family protein disulfide reductase, partial [Thiomicrospira sp.]|nr:TlpA family protein disulfide reductase [Thiomicrospira sp.]